MPGVNGGVPLTGQRSQQWQRDVARGALKAVVWAKDRKPGLYSMADVLSL